MITDRNPYSLKILTCSDSQLTLQHSPAHKMIYKQFNAMPPTSEARIMRWLHFSHPSLLPLCKVQKIGAIGEGEGVTLGVYYQFYGNSLEQILSAFATDFDEEEIVNTFQPVLDAIEYLASQKFQLSAVRLKNIVITEDEEVKFIDEGILSPLETRKNTDRITVYLELCELIYKLLIASKEEKKPKSWKNRLQLIKQRFSKDTYAFFLSIFNKSLVGLQEVGKTKKIAKKKIMQGKQNKISQ